MKQKFFVLTAWLTLFALVLASPAIADDASVMNMVNDMQKEMKNMQRTIDTQNRKIDMLENRGGSGQVVSGEATPPMSDYEFNTRLDAATGGAQKWLKDLKFSGDLRLRYEGFRTDFENGNLGNNEEDYRNRFRYRLRYGFEKKFTEDLKVGFAMASGERSTNAADPGISVDPTSTNTTFDNNFNFKDIFVEKAFASYSPGFLKNIGPLKNVDITGGKMNNAFEKGSSDMIWDRDVKPEGVSEKIDLALLDSESFDLTGYVTAGQFVLDEDSSADGDANLFAYQFGLEPIFYVPGLERPVQHLSAVSLYDYNNYARKSNFLIGTTTLARGNTNADGLATELDAGEFKIFEYYGEIGITPMGLPIKLFFDFAKNTADQSQVINNEDRAYALGAKLGGIMKKGDWELGYAWKEIGANSVVGAFNDSDFGQGHAARKGNVFKGAYALLDNVTFNSAAFFVETLNPGTAGVIATQERRFQVDLVWKF